MKLYFNTWLSNAQSLRTYKQRASLFFLLISWAYFGINDVVVHFSIAYGTLSGEDFFHYPPAVLNVDGALVLLFFPRKTSQQAPPSKNNPGVVLFSFYAAWWASASLSIVSQRQHPFQTIHTQTYLCIIISLLFFSREEAPRPCFLVRVWRTSRLVGSIPQATDGQKANKFRKQNDVDLYQSFIHWLYTLNINWEMRFFKNRKHWGDTLYMYKTHSNIIVIINFNLT